MRREISVSNFFESEITSSLSESADRNSARVRFPLAVTSAVFFFLPDILPDFLTESGCLPSTSMFVAVCEEPGNEGVVWGS